MATPSASTPEDQNSEYVDSNGTNFGQTSSCVMIWKTKISSKYMDFYRMVLGMDGCPLHDPLAFGLALHPEYLVREPYHVEVISTPEVSATDGITIADHRPCALFKDRFKEVTQVCVSVNSGAFVRDLLQLLAGRL